MKHGSTNTRFLREKKSLLKLTELQKIVIIGTILGDGCFIASRSGKAARLQVRQKAKYNEFVSWKYEFFKEWVMTKPRYDRFNDSIVFRTLSHPDLMEVRKIFYRNNVKIVPDNIKDLLTHPLSLAIWFMDDGNGHKKHFYLRLSTYAFGETGNKLLQTCLEENFLLDTKIYHDRKGFYLCFLKDNAVKLYKLIRPYVIPCMEYKFIKVKSITP